MKNIKEIGNKVIKIKNNHLNYVNYMESLF